MTALPAPAWYAADRAYQAHHAGCRTCIAAGSSPNTQTRCPEGAALWATYQQAGDPPHFTWITQERNLRERLQQAPANGRNQLRPR